MGVTASPLQWRHNEREGVSNHQSHYCLLNRLFRRRSKKTSKLRVTGLCEGNSPVTDEVPAQRASNAENVSIWWRHHRKKFFQLLSGSVSQSYMHDKRRRCNPPDVIKYNEICFINCIALMQTETYFHESGRFKYEDSRNGRQCIIIYLSHYTIISVFESAESLVVSRAV